MENRTRITAALTSLTQSPLQDAFVIIENSQTKKFVQFAGSATEPLMLDLPAQTLSELEFYRAVKLFRNIGVLGTESNLLDRPYGEVIGQQFSFNKVFSSIPEAVQIAQDIFVKVYGISADYPLTIIENH